MKKDTINKKEIDKFSKLADEWWDPEGKFKPLHNFNPVRLKYIKDTITKVLYDKKLRKIMIEKGLEKTEKYSWENSANKIFNLITNNI